jgi:hypothetical protein
MPPSIARNQPTAPRRRLVISEKARPIVGLLSVLILGVALWSLFDPGELAEGRVSAVLGTWEADPEGAEAAMLMLGFKAGEGQEMLAEMTRAANRNAQSKMRLTISRDELRFADKSGSHPPITITLEPRPAHHVVALPPGDPLANPIVFRTTNRGLLWNGIPLRQIEGSNAGN